MEQTDNYCVIMGGGIGSRFWPYSREDRPKQFLDFLGTGRSLLQQTVDRFREVVPRENILVVTGERYADLVREQLPELRPEQVLLEPMRRNTAPCIAWAMLHIRARNPRANVVVAPSDHLILRQGEFVDVVRRGLEMVDHEPCLLTLGIRPHRPETGYGYIQVDEQLGPDCYRVKTFTEKPSLELARVFVESGEFFWNSGLFVWNVRTIIDALSQHLPELMTRLMADPEAYGSPREKAMIDSVFPQCPNVSIDFGVMEKADNVRVILGDFGWSDLGTWGSLYDLAPKDREGNALLRGQGLLYDCRDNLVVLPGGRLAVIEGLEGYLVAEADNVLLICRKDAEQAVRRFVNDARMKMGESYV